MNISTTKRRVKVSSGSSICSKIHTLAASHPFSQQLDIILPTPPIPSFLSELEGLETGYWKGKSRLSDILDSAPTFVHSEGLKSDLLVVSSIQHSEDTWCLDPRGHLTLSASKETYERLGLVGNPLPFKGHEDIHIIDIPLHKDAHSPGAQNRLKLAAEIWDQTCSNELGQQDILYCLNDQESSPRNLFRTGKWYSVRCTKNELQDVHVPMSALSSQPPPTKKASRHGDGGAADDWHRQRQSLFEWVGMACLGAQRLNANDRVDPYVALYVPPTPSRVQNVTHLRWRGFLSPKFVETVLETIIQGLQTFPSLDAGIDAPNFISITAHALTSAPVSYIPYTQEYTDSRALQASIPGTVPAKVPSASGEDSWSLVLEQQSDGLRWCLAESIGPGDARWG